MKKKIFFILLLMVILLTGCDNKETVTECNYVNKQTKAGYTITSTYTIYAKGKLVNKVEINQVIDSENQEKLNEFETSLTSQYKTNNSLYGGYEFTSNKEDNKLTFNVTIDYSVLNMELFIKNNAAMKDHVNKKNKLTLEGATKLYQSTGAVCK